MEEQKQVEQERIEVKETEETTRGGGCYFCQGSLSKEVSVECCLWCGKKT